jgi:hypothetical protein
MHWKEVVQEIDTWSKRLREIRSDDWIPEQARNLANLQMLLDEFLREEYDSQTEREARDSTLGDGND